MIRKVVFSGFVGGLVAGLLQLVRMDTFYLIQTIFASFDILSSPTINRHGRVVSETAAEIFVGLIFFALWLVMGTIIAFLGKALNWKVFQYQRAWVIWGGVSWIGLEIDNYLRIKSNPYHESNWFLVNVVPVGIFTLLFIVLSVAASCLVLSLTNSKTELENT